MNRKHTKVIALVIIIAMVVTSMSFVFFLPGLWGAEGYVVYAASQEEDQALKKQLTVLEDYIKYVHDNYKDDVDYQLLIDGAFSGVTEALGDPYSVYYADKTDGDAFQESISGRFNGVGVTMMNENGKCRIVSVMKDSPAEKGGIKADDIIVKIDGTSVTAYSLDEIAKRLRGEVGTKVTVTVERGGSQLSFTLTREQINASSVSYEMLEGDIGYIDIASFDADTDTEFHMAKVALINRGAESLIIDIRDNPGGLINGAINIANEILAEGTITAFERQGKTIQTFTATNTLSLDLPIVLLVNEDTASASEILAAALSENHAATLVGTTTYGKGIAQQIATLNGGESLKLSICYFMSPQGNKIHETGVAPDYAVRNAVENDGKALAAYKEFAPMAESEKPKAGDTGLNVYGAQQRLQLLGFNVTAGGVMDEATVKAVKEFQREEGIYAYGALDYTTMAKLEEAAYAYAHGVSTEDLQLKKAVELLSK